MSIKFEFLNNFNVMGILSYGILLILFIIYLFMNLKGLERHKKYVLIFMKQSAITFGMFNSYNVGFSAGIQFRYSDHMDN